MGKRPSLICILSLGGHFCEQFKGFLRFKFTFDDDGGISCEQIWCMRHFIMFPDQPKALNMMEAFLFQGKVQQQLIKRDVGSIPPFRGVSSWYRAPRVLMYITRLHCLLEHKEVHQGASIRLPYQGTSVQTQLKHPFIFVMIRRRKPDSSTAAASSFIFWGCQVSIFFHTSWTLTPMNLKTAERVCCKCWNNGN